MEIVNYMKIAWLCPYDMTKEVRGGAERHIINLKDEIVKNTDVELHIVYCTNKKNMTVQKEADNITLHPIDSSSLPMTIKGILIDDFKIMKTVKKIDPDIIHAQMIGAPYGLAASLLSKKYPTIVTVHTMTFQMKNKKRSLKGIIHDVIWEALEKWETKRIHAFIAVANNLEIELKRMKADNITVIQNGVEKKWFDMDTTPVPGRIICVGRFQKIKGQDHLLRAIHQVKSQGIEIELHLIGGIFDHKYYNSLKVMIDELNISKNVEFLVDINDDELEKEYGESSIFVLPSREESHPIALLEAMASGKPVIATGVGGVPQMLTTGREGYIIEYGDSDILAKHLQTLLNDDTLRKSMGENGRDTVSKNRWNEISDKTYQLYLNTLNNFKNTR